MRAFDLASAAAFGFLAGFGLAVWAVSAAVRDHERTDQVFSALRARYGANLERKPTP